MDASVTLTTAQKDTGNVSGEQANGAPGLLDGPISITQTGTFIAPITLDASGNFAVSPLAVGVETVVFSATANGVALTATLTATVTAVPEGFATQLVITVGAPT